MSLALVLGVMALAAAAILAVPLLSKGARPGARADFDRAVFRDQLEELDRDLERGIIGADEALAARVEIERRILTSADRVQGDTASPDHGEPGAGAAAKAGLGRSRVLILVLIAVVPALGGGLYAFLGKPGLPDQPLAERPRAVVSPKGLTQNRFKSMVAQVEARLKVKPDEIQGWVILSTAYLRLGRDQDADRALDRAITLAGADKARAASIAVNFSEALMAMNNGQVVPRAKSALDRARALAPKHSAARYYLGLFRLQAGDARAALVIWKSVVAGAPEDAPWLPSLKKRIESTAKERGIDLNTLGTAPTR
jgi:cytochrome c-type biogenesis protein CcmH